MSTIINNILTTITNLKKKYKKKHKKPLNSQIGDRANLNTQNTESMVCNISHSNNF